MDLWQSWTYSVLGMRKGGREEGRKGEGRERLAGREGGKEGGDELLADSHPEEVNVFASSWRALTCELGNAINDSTTDMFYPL